MKKLAAVVLSVVMLLSLVACGNDAGKTSGTAGNTNSAEPLMVGFVYIGDESDAGWTYNHILAQKALEEKFGSKIKCVSKYNVPEGAECADAMGELAEEGCKIIFATSFGFEQYIVDGLAEKYPDVQFLHCSGHLCASDEFKNTHNYFAEIYQARYLAGVVAGMKLNELIASGEITADQAKVGYVAAYPYAEVISGCTAWYLGVASVCDSAKMDVIYSNTWGDYETEYQCALTLIDSGCKVISQHADTTGAAAACETASGVYHVGYNTDMTDVGVTSTLVSSRIDWSAYEIYAVQCMLDGTEIAQDKWGGFEENWVELLGYNDKLIANGTHDALDKLTEQMKKGEIDVFTANYTGKNFDGNTIDLNGGYIENEKASAPSFDFILNDVVTVIK